MQEITGRHVLFFTVGAFGIIIGVNLLMAWKAISTFPGLEVPNSYVASQEFDAKRKAQEALGWTTAVAYEGGVVKLAFTDVAGRPVQVVALSVLIGRRTAAQDDVTPDFALTGDHYEAAVPLARGNWMLRVTATAADGTAFEQRLDLSVRD